MLKTGIQSNLFGKPRTSCFKERKSFAMKRTSYVEERTFLSIGRTIFLTKNA